MLRRTLFILFVMLSRGDFGAIMHIDIHPPLYVTNNTVLQHLWHPPGYTLIPSLHACSGDVL
jgi:hypothetical protein